MADAVKPGPPRLTGSRGAIAMDLRERIIRQHTISSLHVDQKAATSVLSDVAGRPHPAHKTLISRRRFKLRP